MACNCIEQFDEKLKDHNTMLQLQIGFWSNGRTSTTPYIGSEQIEKGRGKKKAVCVVANFCPFCGTSYDIGSDEPAAVAA